MKNKQPLRIIHIEKSPASIRDKSSGRLKASERTILLVGPRKPCSWAVRKKPCKFCGFWNETANRKGLLFEDAVKEVKQGRVELLIGGSITDEVQVPVPQLREMMAELGKTPVEVVLIETRPEYVDKQQLRFMKIMLGDKDLEVAVGLETLDEQRRDALGKGYSKWEAYDAFRKIVDAGALPVTYLLAGSPFVSEDAAAEDFFRSAYELRTLQDHLGVGIRIAVESYFPHIGTLMGQGQYLTPKFIAKMMYRIISELGMHVFVATSSEGLCDHPLKEAKAHFDGFNATQDIRFLQNVIRTEGDMP